MPRASRTHRIKPIQGHPLRYQVESWDRPAFHHEVDLTENGGNGACSCTDFQCKCYPNFKASGGKWVDYGSIGSPNPLRTQCKHIKAARTKFTNDTLRGIAEQLHPNPHQDRRIV